MKIKKFLLVIDLLKMAREIYTPNIRNMQTGLINIAEDEKATAIPNLAIDGRS